MRNIKKDDICVIIKYQHGANIGSIVKVHNILENNAIKYNTIIGKVNSRDATNNNRCIRLATHKERVLRILILANKSIDLTNRHVYSVEMNVDKMKHYINE